MVPTSPARPAKTKNITLAFLVGLVGGIGLALMREYLDNTVKSPDDENPLAAAFNRKSTRLNSSHGYISYAVFCLKKKNQLLAELLSLHIPLVPLLLSIT